MSEVNYEAQLESLNRQILEKQQAATEAVVSQQAEWWSVADAMTISSVILVFGILLMLITTWLLSNQSRSAESILKVIGTLLIIISAVFLVVAGYSDKQIAPVMGLLGTIAGYLLGRETPSRAGTNNNV